MSADPTRRRGEPQRREAVRIFGAVLALMFAAPGAPVSAQDALVCGVPSARTLAQGGVDRYLVRTVPGTQVLIQSSIRSMALGPVRMRLSGAGFSVDTCTGTIQFAGREGDLTLEVSACNGSSSGDYTVELNVISEGAANCGRVLRCGATGDGTGFSVVGEADSFQLPLIGGEPATLKVNYLQSRPNQSTAPYVQIFDPNGAPVVPGVCMKQIKFEPALSGTYTAVVSACGVPDQRAYRLELFTDDCPEGPTITHFGLADAASSPIPPIGTDAEGRPIFDAALGYSFSIVVEARAGANGNRAGDRTVPYGDGQDPIAPDLQLIQSRPLGNGDPTVCDVVPPTLGGVPATVPLLFVDDDEVGAHVADMGCRFDNGRGEPRGRTESSEACTRTDQGDFSFVDRGSAIQYCAQIIPVWGFPDGDTIVAARVKGSDDAFGERREIVVRIGDPATPTASRMPTPTATPTRLATATRTKPVLLTPTSTRTRTASATPTGPTPTATVTVPPGSTATATPTGGTGCVGDCNDSGVVQIDDLTKMVNIALGNFPVGACLAGDANRDGDITLPELIRAVTNLLNGCP